MSVRLIFFLIAIVKLLLTTNQFTVTTVAKGLIAWAVVFCILIIAYIAGGSIIEEISALKRKFVVYAD